MNRLLRPIAALGAIAGGYAQGQMQGQAMRDQQQQGALQQAMQMARTQSGLATDRLQQQMMGMEIEGYETPAQRRQREYQDFLDRQAAQTRAAREQLDYSRGLQQADAEAAVSNLMRMVPTQGTAFVEPVQRPQFAPEAPALDLPRWGGLQQQMGEILPAGPDFAQVPDYPRQATANVMRPAENPLLRSLSEANVPVSGLQFGPGGTVVPQIGALPTAQESEMAGLDLLKARAQTDMLLETIPYLLEQTKLETEGVDLANELKALQIAAQDYDNAATRLATPMELQELEAKLEAARLAVTEAAKRSGLIDAGLQSDDPVTQQMAYAAALGHSYSVQDIGPTTAASRADTAATQRYVADVNAQARVTAAQIKAAIDGGKLELEWEKLLRQGAPEGAAAGAWTKEHEAASLRGVRLLEDFYEKTIGQHRKGDVTAAMEAIMPQLERHIAEAGPLGPDVAAAAQAIIKRLHEQGVPARVWSGVHVPGQLPAAFVGVRGGGRAHPFGETPHQQPPGQAGAAPPPGL